MNTGMSSLTSTAQYRHSVASYWGVQPNVLNQKILVRGHKMEELTPEQKKLQEEIRKKVDILRFVRTHVRLAGIVVQFAGIFAHNTTVSIVGLLIFVMSYAASVGIMEDINLLIWDRPDEQKKEEEIEE